MSSQNGKLCWNNTTEAQKKNTKYVSVVNDPCESTFGIVTNEVKQYENIKLTHAEGMAMCRKNRDFASGYKKIEKDGNYIFLFYINTLSNITTLEFQEKGLINTLPELMVRFLFRVANKYNPVMIEEDQLRLKA